MNPTYGGLHETVTAETGTEAYLELIGRLFRYGEVTHPRGMKTLEFVNATVVVKRGETAHVLGTTRRPAPKILATETVHLLGGLSSLRQLDLASNGNFSQFADRGRLRGAYGPRVWPQLTHVVRLLKRDPDTRQAYVTVWNGHETAADSKDTPCTLGFHFLIRGDALHLITTMRSNDMWLGLPYDWFMFSRLQQAMADALGLPVGSYVHRVGSLHVYERDAARLDAIGTQVDAKYPFTAPAFRGYDSLSTVRTVASEIALRRDDHWQELKPDSGEAWFERFVPKLDLKATYCRRCQYVALGDHCDECSRG